MALQQGTAQYLCRTSIIHPSLPQHGLAYQCIRPPQKTGRPCVQGADGTGRFSLSGAVDVISGRGGLDCVVVLGGGEIARDRVV